MTVRSRESRLDEYLEFARRRPDLFGPPDAGIKILLDRGDIEHIEEAMIRDPRRGRSP